MLKQHLRYRVSKTDEKVLQKRRHDKNKGASQRKPLKKHDIKLSVIIKDLPCHREQVVSFDLGKLCPFHVACCQDRDSGDL